MEDQAEQSFEVTCGIEEYLLRMSRGATEFYWAVAVGVAVAEFVNDGPL
jgi:hypothetical protein